MQDEANEIEYPVDDATYNIMQTLVSKLEAIDAYRHYADDEGGEDAELFLEMARDDMRHAERLLGILKERLNAS